MGRELHVKSPKHCHMWTLALRSPHMHLVLISKPSLQGQYERSVRPSELLYGACIKLQWAAVTAHLAWCAVIRHQLSSWITHKHGKHIPQTPEEGPLWTSLCMTVSWSNFRTSSWLTAAMLPSWSPSHHSRMLGLSQGSKCPMLRCLEIHERWR